MKTFLLYSILLFVISCDKTTNIDNSPIEDPWIKTEYWSKSDWDILETGPRIFFEYAMLNIAPYTSLYDKEKGIMHFTLPGETIKVEITSYEEDGSISQQDSKTITFDNSGRITQWYNFRYSYNSNNHIKTVESTSGTYKDIRNYYYTGLNLNKILRYSGDNLWDSLSYEYSDNGITCVKYSMSSALEFGLEDSLVYKSSNNLGFIDSILGWEYDSDNETWSTEPSVTSFQFNSDGRLIIRDQGYVYWKYSYGVNGKIEGVQIGDNNTYEVKYNANGDVISYNNEKLSKEEFSYDSLSNFPLEKKEYLFNDVDSIYYLSKSLKIKRNL